MATRRGSTPPPVEVKIFTVAEIDHGIAKLRRRIEEVNSLGQGTIRYDDAKVRTAETNIREAIREIFGSNSPEFDDHQYHDIWHGGYNGNDDDRDRQSKFLDVVIQTKTMLEGLSGRLEEKRTDLALTHIPMRAPTNVVEQNTNNCSIFLVHGHDDPAKESVARFLEKLHLLPIILSERSDQGRTIIEKFERNSDVSFAVVLMTPDDVGYPQGCLEKASPRARQNVILELGYFIGRLTRSRVLVLYKGAVEIPSDYHGVLYTQMDDAEGWKLKLARELKQAGMNVNLNDAM